MDISFKPVPAEKNHILHYNGVCKNTPSFKHTFVCQHLRTINKDFTYGRYYDADKSTHNFSLKYINRWKPSAVESVFNFNIDLGSELITEAQAKPAGLRKIGIAEAILRIDKCAHFIGTLLAKTIKDSEDYKIIFLSPRVLDKKDLSRMSFTEQGDLDLEYYWMLALENCFKYCEHRSGFHSRKSVQGIIIDPRPS